MRLFDMHISCFQHQLVDDVDSIVTENKLINCIFSEQNVSIERIALKLDDKNNYAESIIVPLIGQRSAYSRWFFLVLHCWFLCYSTLFFSLLSNRCHFRESVSFWYRFIRILVLVPHCFFFFSLLLLLFLPILFFCINLNVCVFFLFSFQI